MGWITEVANIPEIPPISFHPSLNQSVKCTKNKTETKASNQSSPTNDKRGEYFPIFIFLLNKVNWSVFFCLFRIFRWWGSAILIVWDGFVNSFVVVVAHCERRVKLVGVALFERGGHELNVAHSIVHCSRWYCCCHDGIVYDVCVGVVAYQPPPSLSHPFSIRPPQPSPHLTHSQQTNQPTNPPTNQAAHCLHLLLSLSLLSLTPNPSKLTKKMLPWVHGTDSYQGT